MSNCNSNPTSGCTENLLAIQLKIKKNEADPLFVDIEGVLDDILAKLVSCCAETGTNLDSMYEKLAQVLAINTECCEDINEKLELIAQELCILSENIEPCDESPVTTGTTLEEVTTTSSSTTTTPIPEEVTTTSSSTTTPEPVTTTSSTPNPADISYCYTIATPVAGIPAFPNNQLYVLGQIYGQSPQWIMVMMTPEGFVEEGYVHSCVCSTAGFQIGWGTIFDPPTAGEDPASYGMVITGGAEVCDELTDCNMCWENTTTSSSTTSTTTEESTTTSSSTTTTTPTP